jgi:hypothetical protein
MLEKELDQSNVGEVNQSDVGELEQSNAVKTLFSCLVRPVIKMQNIAYFSARIQFNFLFSFFLSFVC